MGAESPMSPLSTWMRKTVATSTNVTRMRVTTLAQKSCSVVSAGMGS